MVNLKRKKSIKKIVIIMVLGVLLVGILAYVIYAYISWINREVYSAKETISFSDFTVKMIDHSFMDKSGLPDDGVVTDGHIKDKQDCSIYPDVVNSGVRLFFSNPGPEKYACMDANNKIDVYGPYEAQYKKVALNLEIKANKDKSVRVADIKIYINVPSGRDVTKDVDYPNEYAGYTPYGVSSREGYLHSELSRRINTWADLKNDENVVDVVISYKNQQRLYRLES